jgi:hypothetical protein
LLQLIRCYRERIANADFLCELKRVFRVHHGIEFESDNGETTRTIAVEEFLIAWHLFLARLTPSGPEINENDFAVEVRRRNLVTL